jgi:hypothetical protein
MDLLVGALLLANILVSAWLLRRQLATGRELLRTQAAVEGLGGLPAAAPLPRNGGLISVEILNPMELAVRDSRLARAFGSLTPELVRREAYREITRRLIVQLKEQGVVAEVRLHDRAA